MNTNQNPLLVSLSSLAVLLFASCAPGIARSEEGGRVVYVSPSGDDAAAGTLEAPFRTLGRARDNLREGRNSAGGAGTVILRGGTYYLAEPVTFDENDSGIEGTPVIYRNYEGETPILAGGIPVADWQPHQGRILKAVIPQIAGVTRMRFSDNGSTWTAWMPPANPYVHTLPAGAGYLTVRVQYLDGANNYSAVYNDYIKLLVP